MFPIAGGYMTVYHRQHARLDITNATFTDDDLPQLASVFAGPPNLRFSYAFLRNCTFSNGVAEFLRRIETKYLNMIRCDYPGIIVTGELNFYQCNFETAVACVTASPTVPIVTISSVPMSPEEINMVFGVIGPTVVNLRLCECIFGEGDLARIFAAASFPVLEELYLAEYDHGLEEPVVIGLITERTHIPRLKVLAIRYLEGWDSTYRVLAGAVENRRVPLRVGFYGGPATDNIRVMFNEAYHRAVAAKEARVRSTVAGVAAVLALPSGNVRTDDLAVQLSGLQTATWRVLRFMGKPG